MYNNPNAKQANSNVKNAQPSAAKPADNNSAKPAAPVAAKPADSTKK